MIKHLGPVSVRNLVAYCGNPESVFKTTAKTLQKIPGIGPKQAQLIHQANTLRKAEAEVAFCKKHQIRIIPYTQTDYPKNLNYIHHAPPVLFAKGNVDFNAQPAIAIVGTRKCTDWGREKAFELGAFFGQRGLNVISGLAYGIDIAAHKGALSVDGITTASLGHSLDYLYPSIHKGKAKEMLLRGALLTEFPSGHKPEALNFPARNRIISGLCKAVIVVEAAESGGALITARFAFDQNREVYAIPGRLSDPYSVGCNKLIQQQVARLLLDPQEVLDQLEIQWEAAKPHSTKPQLQFNFSKTLSAEENKIMNLLDQQETTVDRITQLTKIPISKLNSLLLEMEFKGLVSQSPGKKFRRL